jgi:DNA-binding MarR family transcriptional regulator
MNSSNTAEDLYKLWVLFAMTRDAIFWATQEELTQYELSPVRSAVMFFINSLGSKATPSRIGKILLRKRNSISELLVRMEKDSLVKRLKVSPKRNLKRYELTQKGRELYQKTEHLKTIENIFSSLSPEQREQLSALLHDIFRKTMKELKMDSDIPLEAVSK